VLICGTVGVGTTEGRAVAKLDVRMDGSALAKCIWRWPLWLLRGKTSLPLHGTVIYKFISTLRIFLNRNLFIQHGSNGWCILYQLFFDCLDPKDGRSRLLRNVGNYLKTDKVSFTKRLESSPTFCENLKSRETWCSLLLILKHGIDNYKKYA
jgi:hypothetical protein